MAFISEHIKPECRPVEVKGHHEDVGFIVSPFGAVDMLVVAVGYLVGRTVAGSQNKDFLESKFLSRQILQ